MTRIETEKQYQAAMTRIEELLPLVTEDTPLDDANSIELVRLSNLVADYDDKHFPIMTYKENVQKIEDSLQSAMDAT